MKLLLIFICPHLAKWFPPFSSLAVSLGPCNIVFPPHRTVCYTTPFCLFTYVSLRNIAALRESRVPNGPEFRMAMSGFANLPVVHTRDAYMQN